MELNNSYSSKGSSFGINAGATVGYGHKMQTTGNGGSVSLGRSSQNTVEAVYHNGSFANVNEVHNNTGTMTVSGFNQEGGKVTGNINKLIMESRQNTSTTTGRSSGMNIGVSSQGIPSSVGISGSRTEGSRAYVDNQTTFIAGEGSNLTVGKAENTGAVISAIGNGTIDIQSYTGKDIQNYDTMKTTGASVGFTTGNVPLSNIGFNQETRDKEGTARNTVTGNVNVHNAEGNRINRDTSKANETIRDTYSRTDINVESQTIQYAANPDKLKEDLNKAGQEIRDAAKAFNESVNDRGDDNRNFLGQLREIRLNETIENIAGEKWKNASTSLEVSEAYRMALKDLGYDNVQIIFSDTKNSPQLIDENGRPKAGTAFVRKDGARTIIINVNAEENQTKAGLIGTISEEGSHIVGKLEGRQIETGTAEKGLESTGRATNEYFKDKYRDSDRPIELASDGRDYSGVDFGENVGDRCIISEYSCATEVHQTNKNREISTTTSKNYRKKINSFNTLTGKMKSECKSSRKCAEKNGVFVFEKYEDFVYYSEKYKGTGKRDRIRLDYRQNHEKTVVAKENQNNRILQGIEGRYDGKYTKEKGLYTFTDEKAQAQFEKEAREKGATVYTVLSNDKITASSINLNSYKPPYQKQAEQLGTQAFIFAEQNLKIGDGSTKVSDETLALAASSTISDVVRSGLFVIEKTEDKRYEENNPGVQNQVKKLKKEADRLTSESKDRDYYVRVDSKNRTVTIEEDDKPKSYRDHFLNDVLINPLKSASDFGEARNSLLKGDLDRTLQNGLEGIGNFFSLFTLGIGSWAGDHFDRFSPNEVQYGTKQEVERRRATENGIVKTATDSIVSLNLPKSTGNWNIPYPQVEVATSVNVSGTLTNSFVIGKGAVSVPAMTITGGKKAAGGVSNIAKMASQNSEKDSNNSKIPNDSDSSFSIGLGTEDINFAKNPIFDNLKSNIKKSIYNPNINAHTFEGYNILNDYPASSTRPTYRQSEKDLTEVLKKASKNDSSVDIQIQQSYKNNRAVDYGTSKSVRPDNVKLENKIVIESFEMKNYKIENYDNMANTIVKQIEQRKQNLPLTTRRQNIVIDARGQGITYSQEQEIIRKIIEKSNGTIKNSDITIWK